MASCFCVKKITSPKISEEAEKYRYIHLAKSDIITSANYFAKSDIITSAAYIPEPNASPTAVPST